MAESFTTKCRKLENALAVYRLAEETYLEDYQNDNLNTTARDEYNRCCDYVIELCREIVRDTWEG